MKRIKVLFFSPSLVAGGLERVLSALSSPLASHYDEVVYVIWHDKPIFYHIDERVRVISVGAKCGDKNLLSKMRWLRRFVREEAPDILISFSTPFNMIALLALFGMDTKTVVAERNDPTRLKWGNIAKIVRNVFYIRACGVLVQTETAIKSLGKTMAEKATVIPNPIIIDKAKVGAALTNEKKEKIVTVARLVPQKRIDLLIRVFNNFVKCHPDYRLEIYGEGQEKERLQACITEMNLHGKVMLCGVVKDVWNKMLDANMFVMSSDYEGMSNALLEAMSLGLPCISTKVNGAIDVIEQGGNGILVDVGDETALQHAMTLLADDKDLCKKIGRNATLIAEKFSLPRVSQKWIDYIDNCIRK